MGDTTSGPQDIQAVATGEIDTGGAFNGSVAKLQQAGSKVTGVVSTYGSDDQTFYGYYSLERSGIETAQDLVGKTVGINTLGAYHEYAIKQWLHREGVSDADIKEVALTVVPPINTELALRQGQLDAGNLGTVFKRNENTDFVKKWKSPGIPVPGGVIKPEEFTVWVDEAVRLGELPAGIKVEELFTNEFNPSANGTYPPDSNEDGV